MSASQLLKPTRWLGLAEDVAAEGRGAPRSGVCHRSVLKRVHTPGSATQACPWGCVNVTHEAKAAGRPEPGALGVVAAGHPVPRADARNTLWMVGGRTLDITAQRWSCSVQSWFEKGHVHAAITRDPEWTVDVGRGHLPRARGLGSQ